MEKTCIGSRWKKWGWRELRSLFLFCYASLQQCQAHSKDGIERLESLVQDELQLPFTHGFGFQALPPFMATWTLAAPRYQHTHTYIYIYIYTARLFSTYVEREYELSRPFKREKIMKKNHIRSNICTWSINRRSYNNLSNRLQRWQYLIYNVFNGSSRHPKFELLQTQLQLHSLLIVKYCNTIATPLFNYNIFSSPLQYSEFTVVMVKTRNSP
jgi:hypothetical protein